MKIDDLFLFFLVVTLILTGEVSAGEWSGYVAAEARLFAYSPNFSNQKRHNASVALQPDYYHEWKRGRSFTFVPFLRLDSADSERTHFDIRELFGLRVFEDWELGVGIRKVFWGVTESQHLIDIINQTDFVESIDGEEKLGQPMINLSVPRDWGTIDVFILPYFRERTFPGSNGRLRSASVVDTDQTVYESGAKEYHIDAAIRYSHTIGDWDIGLSHFRGTGREPTLTEGTDNEGNSVLIPSYEQINQTGLDLQWVADEWLWKLETIYRTGQGDGFFAWTGGFEYTFVGIAGSGMDLGVISEWLYDDRGDDATTPFEDDIMIGFRLAVNDAASTEALFGVIQDFSSDARFLSLESSRRLGDHWKATLEMRALLDQPDDDLLDDLRDDDFLQIELAYYF